jgi:hypothetical protein
MKKLILVLSAAAALLAAGAATVPDSSSAATCGNTTYEGLRARHYCGSATAVVKFAGRTLTYRGGSCLRNSTAIELGIGTAILDIKEPKTLPRSFGISVGRVLGIGKAARGDGAHQSVMIAFVDKAKRYASMKGKAVLAGGRTRGTFTAELFDGTPVSGTFRCG